MLGRLIVTAVVAVAVVLARVVLAPALRRRHADDAYRGYSLGRLATFGTLVLGLVVLVVVWAPLGGRASTVIGFATAGVAFATAGVAFAMQQVIGAIFGWFNILSGRIFRVGDRIEMGGVRGDVIDLTP